MKIKPKLPKNSKREKEKFHTIWGMNNSLAVLDSESYKVIAITLLDNYKAYKSQKVQAFCERNPSIIKILQKTEFLRKYDEFRTQGIVVQFTGKTISEIPDYSDTSGDICLILLDQITDPQNLGQIIRTSECAGVNGIVLPENHSVGLTDSVLQVSQGAFVYQPIYRCGNVHQTLNKLKDQGFWVIGVENSINAKPWYEIDYSGKVVIIVGSEGKGIRPLVLKTCDFLATIPMQGKVNSLNVTAAVSAILFERNRQL